MAAAVVAGGVVAVSAVHQDQEDCVSQTHSKDPVTGVIYMPKLTFADPYAIDPRVIEF